MSGEPPDRSSRAESAELLAMAEQIGRLGVIEWDVPAGTVRLSLPLPRALRPRSSISTAATRPGSHCVYREDQRRGYAMHGARLSPTARRASSRSIFGSSGPSDGELRWIEARRLIFYDGAGTPRARGRRQRRRHGAASARSAQLRAFTETLEEAVRARTHELEAENEARARPRTCCASRRKWRRSASSPAASRTTSTIC